MQKQLASKSLDILKDQLKNEAHACCKSKVYAQIVTDPSLQSFFNGIAQHHQQHCDAINQYLNQY